jgi:hypothetical protein
MFLSFLYDREVKERAFFKGDTNFTTMNIVSHMSDMWEECKGGITQLRGREAVL